MVFPVIFNSSLIIQNFLDIQSFFSILAFHINNIMILMLHIFLYKMTIHTICIYWHFNRVFMKFIDIMCIRLDLFLCSCQYAQQNVAKSSNSLRMKHIKNTRSSANNHDNRQCKQKKTIQITNHSKNENHVKNVWKWWWILQFLRKLFHNIITFSVSKITVMFVNFRFVGFFFCKMWLFIALVFWLLFCVSYYLCSVSACLFLLCFLRKIFFLLVVLFLFVQTM